MYCDITKGNSNEEHKKLLSKTIFMQQALVPLQNINCTQTHTTGMTDVH